MKAPSASLASLSLIGFLAACSDLAAPIDPLSMPGTHSGGQGASHAGASGTGDANGGKSSKGGSGSGSSAQAGNGGSGGSLDDSTLSLTSVDAHVVGRDGNAVRFTVNGTRPASGVYSIAVTFEDAQGMPVEEFDGDFDGTIESSDGRIVFDAPVSEDTFTATATLTGIKDVAKLVTAKVQLVDGSDTLTDPVEATIGAQKVRVLGDTCDPNLELDRCDAGQSCPAMTMKCIAGAPPALIEAKYFHATIPNAGPTLLLRGTDPDDDMGTFHVEFLDNNNKPVTVDPDNPTTTYDSPAARLSLGGSYVAVVLPGLTLETSVPKVRVTPLDSLGHSGSPLTANINNMVRAGDGATCDPRGFSGCVATSVCASGTSPISGKCTKGTSARATACAAAPKLNPDAGITSLAGRLTGGSLWEPPAGCTGPENTGRPDAAIALHLGSKAKTLTITTMRPETHTDTVLSLVAGCADVADVKWCHDDSDSGFASTLTLSDVPAGEYTIIVEAGHFGDGEFGVSVDAK
ncbi:MAG: hypothetical protein ABIQ16_14040 [Polyangiaceae bacterium]